MLVFYLLVFEKKRDGWNRGYAGPRCPARQGRELARWNENRPRP